MAQGTRRIQNCNESMEEVKAAVELSSHATILKSGRRKSQSKCSKRHPIGKIIGVEWVIRVHIQQPVSVLARLLLCPTDGWTRGDPVNSEHLKQSQFLFANRINCPRAREAGEATISRVDIKVSPTRQVCLPGNAYTQSHQRTKSEHYYHNNTMFSPRPLS
jgi:hypothetical protein